MESLLGFNESAVERSRGYKLVPWLRWDEWDCVRESLFSSSPDSVSSALQRIMAWRSRGCLPVEIEVTASIIEIQQKDPFFRVDLGDNASESEEMLAMLFCMAIMRLVNGVVEKTRKKTEVSIAEAADALNIPRMLIDIRHEGSHRDLPSLRLVRLASIKALDWLKSYYWEPQQKAIPFQSDGTACLRKEIKSRLCELALRLKIRQPTSSSSSLARGIKHCEPFCGRNKFLSFMPRRAQHPKFAGSRKQINLALKHVVQLYLFYSSEVVSVLVELLLKGSDCLDVTGFSNCYEVGHDTSHVQSVFDDWKPVISKLSNKEPQMLLTLIKAVLEMIETRQAMKCESDNIGSLLDLFEWLVRNLKGLNHVDGEDTAAVAEGSSKGICLPKATLVELLRRTLLVSCPGNNQLRNSALVLAQMIGNSSLVEKLNKLYLLWESNAMNIDNETCSIISYDSIQAQQEDSIHQAAEKLELVKRCRMKSKANMLKTTDGDVGNNSRWVVPKSWNPCPIGMLPCDVGSSGRLPVLDRNDVDDDDDNNNNNKSNAEEVPNPSESKQQRASKEGIHKRGPDCNVEALDESCVKKRRGTEDACESDGKDDDDDTFSEGVKGQLMIGGVWKKVGEEDLLAIASAVRILV